MDSDDLHYEPALADAAGDRRIAERLDALEAEKVMQRALELEAESLDEPHTITTEQLNRIAKELGVDPAFVEQALGEVRLKPPDRGWFASKVLPDHLVETATIAGLSREDVDASITKWMTQNEGLTLGGVLPNGAEWDIDKRWVARLRSSTLSGSNRMSRVAGGDIAHRVHSVNDDEHVVAFESQGRGPVLAAGALMTIGALAAATMLLGGVASSTLLGTLLVAGAALGAAVGIGVAGARWWARGIRGALRRSLVGLVGTAKPRRKGWFSRRRKKNKPPPAN